MNFINMNEDNTVMTQINIFIITITYIGTYKKQKEEILYGDPVKGVQLRLFE